MNQSFKQNRNKSKNRGRKYQVQDLQTIQKFPQKKIFFKENKKKLILIERNYLLCSLRSM